MPQEVIDFLTKEDTFVPLLFAFVGTIWIVLGTIGGTIKAISRERTRREIAAYIAEGSMSPEQGERLLRARNRA